MAIKGYQSYRGRSAGRGRVMIVLLVLILVAACAFMFMQRYITYTDDGGIRIDLPFLRKEAEPEEPVPAEELQQPDMDLYIGDAKEPLQPKEPEDQPVDSGESTGRRQLVMVDVLPADKEALENDLSAAGANGFVFTVKDNAGLVRYSSDAALRDAVAADAVDRETLAALCGDEKSLSVARLNCFHDSYYAYSHMESAGICQSSGHVWYDPQSYFWLDPEKDEARRYVIALALECAQLGFDELLLDEMAYPAEGNLEKIDYSGNQLSKGQALELFLTELKRALEPYDIRISLLLGEELVRNGSDAESGQALEQLLPMVDAVYVPTGDAAAVREQLEAAAGEGGAPELVVLAPSLDQSGSWCLTSEE